MHARIHMSNHACFGWPVIVSLSYQGSSRPALLRSLFLFAAIYNILICCPCMPPDELKAVVDTFVQFAMPCQPVESQICFFVLRGSQQPLAYPNLCVSKWSSTSCLHCYLFFGSNQFIHDRNLTVLVQPCCLLPCNWSSSLAHCGYLQLKGR